MKVDTNKLYAIFLLKKNIWADIIKIILGYSPIAALETLKKWKMAIILVEQGYKSIEGQHNYWTDTETIYGGRGLPMDIGKSDDKFKDRQPKCFNCKEYGHITKNYKKPKKEKDTWKCYECGKVRNIAKSCRTKMKKRSVQEERNIDDNDKEDK